jgi:nucleolar protein 9
MVPQYHKKLPAGQVAPSTTQGSVLLQSWLSLSAPHQQPVIDSLHSLSTDSLIALTRDVTASRVLDSFLSSPTTPPRELRKFLMSLLGHYHTIADDRIGSRVVERMWATADVYLKDKIAASLVDQGNFLQSSQFGHFFARKVELPLWERRREEWKLKMANAGKPAVVVKKVENKDAAGEKKRRERPVDEVDEIFAAGRSKKGKTEVVEVEEVKSKRVVEVVEEDMEDVFAALKASVV